ncbi:MAG: ferritin [Acidimicrobiia bacterium]|jgi:ferritin
MRMRDDLAEAFNAQITMELASSVVYLQMAAYFDSENFVGMGSWMKAQAEEEREHAHRFFEHVLDRGNDVSIGSIDAPPSGFDNVEAVFTEALAQEQSVTKAIHDLYRLATEQGDLASLPFLQTFIEEQIEEESTVETILQRVRLAGGESTALLLLDGELGGRG